MKAQQMMLGGLMAVTMVFATQPLKALAAPSATVDGACRAKMAHASDPGMAHHRGGPEATPYLHGLKLSEAQQDQIFELMHKKVPQFREVREKARQSQDELNKESFSERHDAARSKSLAEAAGRKHGEMLALRAEADQQIYALLSPEQRKKLAADFAGKPSEPAL